MSQIRFLFLIAVMAVLVAQAGASVESITLDGLRETDYGSPQTTDPAGDLARPGPGDWSGTAWADLTALYLYHDSSYLYLYADLPAYSQAGSSGQIGLLIDVGSTAAGGPADPWLNAITFNHANKPEFAIRGNIPGMPNNPPDDNNGWTELRTWLGSAWSAGGVNWGGITGGGQVGTKIAYADSHGVEFRIPLSDLGLSLGQTLNVQFFATQSGSTKGAFDTLPTDDQSTGWDDPTTLSQWVTYTLGNGTATPTSASTPTPSQTPTLTPIATSTPTPGGPVCAGAAVGDALINTTAIYHDSTDLAYRDPLGSIEPDGSAALRLRLCENDVEQVEVMVWLTGDPLDDPSFIYPAAVVAHDPSGPYSTWEAVVPGPGLVIDQWYQFRVTDGGRVGYYHVLSGSGNSGPGAWSDSLLDLSWKLGTIPPPPQDYTVPSWMQDAVIYQVFPDRFRNGNPANDPMSGRLIYGPTTCNGYPFGGAPECVVELRTDWLDLPRNPGYGLDFFGGDLQGVIDKLPYLADLGINVLYLNPIFEASSNHGYDTNDYYNVRAYFGDNALFDTLIAQANSYGIRIILDGVFNHTGSDSKYIDGYGRNRWPLDTGACEAAASPYRPWFKSGNHGRDACDGGWGWQGWYGFETIPELLEIDAVKDFFFRGGSPQSPAAVSVTEYWLDKGIAGWRFDVAQDISHTWWQEMRLYLKTVYGSDDVLMLGEVTGGCDWGLYQSYVNQNELDSVMNYCFRDWAVSFANGNAPSSFDSSFNSFRALFPPSPWQAMMNLVDSHDSTRVLNLLGENKDRLKLLVILQMTLPGAPSVYYGDEVGLSGGGDPDNRRTYPWADLGGNPDLALFDHYKTLIAIRRAHSALRGGDMATLLVSDANHLYSYYRWDETEQVVVALNNGTSAATAAIPVSTYLPDGATLTDALNGGSYTVSGGLLAVPLAAQWGAILVSQTAPTPTPTFTPTPTPTFTPTPTLTPTPTPAANVVVNGDFESGPGVGWTEYSNSGRELITTTRPHTGLYSASECGLNSCTEYVEQTVTIPTNGRLTYWWYMTSQEGATAARDLLRVQLYRPDGTLITTLRTWSNRSPRDAWQQDSINLAAGAGQIVRLRFTTVTNATRPTTFYIDDATLSP
ncbi:MAG: alpha-amylase family glycosyl hydrolase [Chloroflexota bacterium]